MDRRVLERSQQERTCVNPTWLWSECVHCQARFKTRHYGTGELEAVGDEEWRECVLPREP